MGKAPVSVIILTYNEEVNIKVCLERVRELTEEIFIVDSYSTDATVAIARQYTDHIFQNPWTNYAGQRQWALANLPLSHDWVFFVDADERLSQEIVREINEVLNKETLQPGFGAYSVPRRFFFLGKWLRWGGCSGGLRELRLCNRHYLTIAERAGHEVYICHKSVGELQGYMIHEDLKPLTAWIDRHNRYSTSNAEHLWSLKNGSSKPTQVLMEGLQKPFWFSSLFLKEAFRHKVWLRLPLVVRPFLLFIYKFIFRMGFLDGFRGAIYHLLHDFWYPLLVDAKYINIKASQAVTDRVYEKQLHKDQAEKIPVSVITLTLNEKANIRACLKSAGGLTQEIFVVDAGSKDETLEIAREYTDKIYQKAWTSHPQQRQWALDHLPFTHDWVLFLDADERLTDPLILEIGKVIREELRSPRFGAYYVPKRFVFLGKEVLWGDCWGGMKELRLCNRQHLKMAGRAEHPVYLIDKEVDDLSNDMIHEDKKSLSAWISRHNIYSSNDARYLWKQCQRNNILSLRTNLVKTDKRLYWKERVREKFFNKLPIGFRPIFLFLFNYVFKLGVLDGEVGLIYHYLHTFWYPLLIDAKLLELKYRHQTNGF